MKAILERLVRGDDLHQDEARALVESLTDPRVEPAAAGAVLAALRAKGETAEEVRGFAVGMRGLARRVDLGSRGHAVDLVGPGGDGSGSYNLTTGAALLAAASGAAVVKHGNRSVSSRSGSADVLERLGYPIPEGPSDVLASLDRLGFSFLFAPNFHPAMRTVAPVRRAMGIRTIFNILGPLTNPAAPPHYVLGAFSPDVARLLAKAMAGLDIERAFVVHGEPGWDEPTPVGPFLLLDVHGGSVREEMRDPRDHDIPRCAAGDLIGGDATYNANAIRDVFGGDAGGHRDALLLGAGLALEVSGVVEDLDQGVERARGALETGAARRLLDALGSS
jgi:anthranilate phosphoribosyltransferase